MAIVILVGLAFIVGAAVVMGGYLGVTKGPGMMAQQRLESRLQDVLKPAEERRGDSSELFKESKAGPLPAIDHFIRGTSHGTAISRWIADVSGGCAMVDHGTWEYPSSNG